MNFALLTGKHQQSFNRGRTITMNRRHFLGKACLLAGSASLFSYALAQAMTMNEAINKSGRQRMLSQRMAKAYLQIGQAVNVEQSKKILAYSLTLFERQLSELHTIAPTAENRLLLSEIDKVWLSYKQLLSGKAPNQADAKSIMVINEDMLTMTNNATLQLEKHAANPAGKLVNIAGRQRMLSQRMAKFYQAQQWGVAPPDAQAKLDLARKEFIAGMQTLGSAPGNTARINNELALAQQQWLFFDGALRQKGDGKPAQNYAADVATTSERILEVMDGITSLYQQLG